MEKVQKKVQKRLANNLISHHGCGLYRLDGSNILITKDFPCSTPIKNCFWMKAKDATNIIRTRSKMANNIARSNLFKKNYLRMKSSPITSYSSDESSYSDAEFSDEASESSNTNISLPSGSSYTNLVIDTDETTPE